VRPCRFGYHVSRNHYFICPSPQTVMAIFEDIRHTGGQAVIPAPAVAGVPSDIQYPAACGPYAVASVRDVTLGLDTGERDGTVCRELPQISGVSLALAEPAFLASAMDAINRRAYRATRRRR